MQKGRWLLLYERVLGTNNIKVGWILLRLFLYVFSYIFHSLWTKKADVQPRRAMQSPDDIGTRTQEAT